MRVFQQILYREGVLISRSKRVVLSILMGFILANCVLAETAKQPQSLKKVTLMLDWTPNTNHTGLYVAKFKGYYEAVGLDVELLQSGKLSTSLMVGNQQVKFGISYQETLSLARAAGIPVVSLAAIIQQNTSGFYAKASSGIKTPKDFEGRTYGSWNSEIEQKTIATVMKNVGGDPNLVKQMGIGDLDFFKTEGMGIDFVWGYEAWTGIKAKLEGVETVYFPVRDYANALNNYTPIIITHVETIQKEPDLVRALIQATQKGYEYAIEHPTEAAEILLKAVPELDRTLILESQMYLSPRYQGDTKRWGWQDRAVFVRYNDWLLENGLIDAALDADLMFTNQFLQDAN